MPKAARGHPKGLVHDKSFALKRNGQTLELLVCLVSRPPGGWWFKWYNLKKKRLVPRRARSGLKTAGLILQYKIDIEFEHGCRRVARR